MKVYVLTADTYDDGWGSEIELFGVFSSEEKAKDYANKTELYNFDIDQINVDEVGVKIYLGGYIE